MYIYDSYFKFLVCLNVIGGDDLEIYEINKICILRLYRKC